MVARKGWTSLKKVDLQDEVRPVRGQTERQIDKSGVRSVPSVQCARLL